MPKKIIIGLLSVVLVGCTYSSAPKPYIETGATVESHSGDIVTSSGVLVLEEEAQPTEEIGENTHREKLLSNGILEIGDPNAKLTLLVFTEHHCGYCQDFTEEILPRLQSEFIGTNKLKVQVVIRTLKKYPGSEESARALFCAGKQGAGVHMHELLFKDPEKIPEYVSDLSLNAEEFSACTISTEAADAVAQEQLLAQTLNVTFVPTFFLDGEEFVGLPYYADLKGRIEKALRK